MVVTFHNINGDLLTMGDLLLSMGSDDDCIVMAEPEQQQQQQQLVEPTTALNIAHFDNPERVGTDQTPDPVQRVQVRETQCHQFSKSIRRKVSISRCAQATTMFVLLSTLVASVTSYFEIEDVPPSLTSSIFTKATGMIQDLFVSSDGAQDVHQKQAVHGPSSASVLPMDMDSRRQIFEENTLNILRRQEEENRFRRQEEILRREHIHARMEAQEEKRIEAEEQRRVMEENRLRMLLREGEERLRREQKSTLSKKLLARERQARIDALEEKRRILEDQWRAYQDLQGDEEAVIPQDQETVAEAEDVFFPPLHIRRRAKLYTFVY
jgi:hypothetical protein